MASTKRKRPLSRDVDDDDTDEWDIKNWTSRHYDDENTTSAIEKDLFDPHPSDKKYNNNNKRKKKYGGTIARNDDDDDDGGGSKMMDEDGMFLSLEVLPANTYTVERTGDEVVGYVTKVIYKTGREQQGEDDNAAADTIATDNACNDLDNNDDDNNNNDDDADMTKRKEKAKRKREKAKLKKMESRNNDKDDGGGEEEKKATKIAAIKSTSKEISDGNTSSESINTTMTKKESRRMKREAKKLLLVKLQDKGQQQQHDGDHTHGTRRRKANNESGTPSTKTLRQNHNNDDDIDDDGVNDGVEQLRTSWSIAAPGISLHPILSKGLHRLSYAHPTPIQCATLPPAILGRRDIVGAAPTGSGKTLSYGLPILQRLLDERDEYNEQQQQQLCTMQGVDENHTNDKTTNINSNIDSNRVLRALILVPTRELAMQVEAELLTVCLKSIGIRTIVGGFAEAKQRRVLEKERPAIVVATPGRLWELMSSKDYEHLNDLTQLSFLVVDEADRMIKQGSFPQLQQIFEVINTANPPPPDDDDDDDEDDIDDDDDDHTRLKGIAGVRGEAKVVMLDDSILAAIERQRNGGGDSGGEDDDNADVMMKHGKDDPAVPMEMDDEEYERQMQQLGHVDNVDYSSDEEEKEEQVVVYHHRQTFVYSATLTLPPSMHHLIKKDIVAKMKMKKRKGGKNKQPTTVDGAIAEILDIAGARGETKIVDLTNAGGSNAQKNKKNVKKSDDEQKGKSKTSSSKDGKNNDGKTTSSLLNRLPPGLTLGEIRCAQRHKDSHLYAYLVTTRQGSSGPCLVFCNSIAAVRRVGETLKTLGLPVKMLHAQMQQKSRLGALESLRTPNSRSIVVASDVAARGLDIQAVTTVVHYDVARSVDTFIHRAGRTARGVGEKAVGTSVSLVAPAEEREHQKICETVQGAGSRSLDQVSIDGRLLNEAQERVSLATKIVSCNDVESQAVRKNKWLQDAANDAGLDVDEDMIEGGMLGGDQRDRQRFIDANRAKTELRQLLAKPMRIQHFGKFLSGVGLRESIKSEGEVKPFVVHQSATKTKHRQRKGSNK